MLPNTTRYLYNFLVAQFILPPGELLYLHEITGFQYHTLQYNTKITVLKCAHYYYIEKDRDI